MAIDPTSDLFKAILSMDSYNRGYGSSLDFNIYDENGNIVIPSDASGTMLGSVEILASSSTILADSDLAIGFYALAYQLPDDSVTISYRGTDGPPLDAENGFGVGAGLVWTAQSEMAFDFYTAVADSMAGISGSPPQAANISLTGHSLGGGLAGLVGAAYGRSGTLFNNMAFEEAVENLEEITHDPQSEHYEQNFKETVYDLGVPWAANFNGLKTIYTQGDFLGGIGYVPGVEDYQEQEIVPINGLSLGDDVELPGIDAAGLHNISSLVIRMFASEQTSGINWNTSAKFFWPVLYDNAFSYGIGIAEDTSGTDVGAGNYASILRTMIAYSAVDNGAESARPFGDTAIRALYDDANDLGVALAAQNTALEPYALAFSQVFVEYAGKLAYNKILQSSTYASSQSALEGVLDRSGNVLRADFSHDKWEAVNISESNYQSESSYDLISALADIPEKELFYFLYYGNNVREVAVSVSTAGGVFVSAGYAPEETEGDSIFQGWSGSDTAIGNIGRDHFYGGAGDDVLVGGAGDDVLVADRGNDVLHGGFVKDELDAARPDWNSTGQFSSLTDMAYANDGNDRADYTSMTEGSIVVTALAPSTFTVAKGPFSALGTDHLYSVEAVWGTFGNDTFIGTGGGTVEYFGGGGVDTYSFDLDIDRGSVTIFPAEGFQVETLKFFNVGEDILVSRAEFDPDLIVFSQLQPDPNDPAIPLLVVDPGHVQNIELNGVAMRTWQLNWLASEEVSGAALPDETAIYNLLFGNGGPSDAGGGTLPTYDSGGEIANMQVRPDVGSRYLNYGYAEEYLHPFIITSYSGGAGGSTMTFDTYLQSIEMVEGISAEDVRFTVNSSPGNASLTIHIDALGNSYTIPYYETGKTLTGIALYDSNVHGWVQGVGAALQGGGQGNFTGTYTEEYTLTTGFVQRTYYLEAMHFAGSASIDLQQAMTFTGTSSADTLYGLDTRGDTLKGLAGNDDLRSYGGNDTLIGGTGADQLTGGLGLSLIHI